MKLKTVFICEKCSFESQKWLGKCPNCDAWNSMIEDVINTGKPERVHTGLAQKPEPLFKTSVTENRIETGISELDRVLGGGIVNNSLILLSGEPGIGKSTITLKVCEKVGLKNKKVLYISGEESQSQVASRAERLGIKSESISFLSETNFDNILLTIESEKPDFVVVDSIQVVASQSIPSIAGSINQVRFCTESLMNYAKKNDIAVLIVGHVTKDGTLAGPRILEHLVDTVLFIEGERFQDLRILRALKNRFGSTNEIGIFEMREDGLIEVTNPSEIFIGGRKTDAFGSSITTIIEGSRPLLVEIQALTNYTNFGYPKRAASGYDNNRLQLLVAVIQKHLHLNLNSQDVYINVVGGLRVSDPATDLAVVMAIISSLKKEPLDSSTVYLGEIGLSGEIRSINKLENRIQEAEKVGFQKVIAPKSSKKTSSKKIELENFSDITSLFKKTFSATSTQKSE